LGCVLCELDGLDVEGNNVDVSGAENAYGRQEDIPHRGVHCQVHDVSLRYPAVRNMLILQGSEELSIVSHQDAPLAISADETGKA
jgi:hypothetical protein